LSTKEPTLPLKGMRTDSLPETPPMEQKGRSEEVLPEVRTILIQIIREMESSSPDSARILHSIVDDLVVKYEAGKKKYGTTLKTFNYRNAARDQYQEELDRIQYFVQDLMETKSKLLNQNTPQLPFEFVIGICGMQGVGKTSVAKGLMRRCSFIYDEYLAEHLHFLAKSYGVDRESPLYRKLTCGIGAVIRDVLGSDSLLKEAISRAERRHPFEKPVLVLHSVRGDPEVEAIRKEYPGRNVIIEIVRDLGDPGKDVDPNISRIDRAPISCPDHCIDNNGSLEDSIDSAYDIYSKVFRNSFIGHLEGEER